MAKRKRNDVVSSQHHEEDDEVEQDEDDDKQQLRAVFVDTSIDTNIIVLISPFSSFSLLKERIVREHTNCFAELGEIKINALKVKREQKYYHLSESMLLRTAFHGVESWFVFADVDRASLGQSPKTYSDPVTELQLNLTNHEHVSNLPNDPSKDFESIAMGRKSDISSPGDHSSKRKRKKKEKHNSEDLSREALTSSLPAEDVHKIKSNNAVDESLLETKGLMSGFEGGNSETKQPVSKKDNLQKNDDASIPSKAVETSTAGEVRTKEMRYSHPDTAGHVHDASSVSTDAKETPELPAQIEGSTLNHESVVHNGQAISESRVKKTKKKKKGGDGDGVDKIYSMTVGVAAEKELISATEETPLKQTDDSKLLLSQHVEVNKEDVPLMSSELKKNTKSWNASKKRRTSKGESENQDVSMLRGSADPESADARQKGASTTSGETLKEASSEPRTRKTKKTNTKDVNGVDRSPQVLKSIQDDVAALDSEKAVCERESNSKITAEEKIMETSNIAKKKKTFKTKETDQDLDDSRQDIDISKPEQNPESANVTEGTKGDKSKPSKKTKKSKKIEGTSHVLPQIVNGNSAAEPAKSREHEENTELQNVNPKKMFKSRQSTPAVHVPENPVLEQVAEGKMADDDVFTSNSLSAYNHQTELNDGVHEHLNDNAVQKDYSQETDMRNMVKQTTKKSKFKKPDRPPSIDTSFNLMTVEKDYESERTSLVSHQLQSDVHEAGLVKVIGVESIHPQLNTPEVNGEITSVKPKKRAQRKHSASENSSAILHMTQQLDAGIQKTADDGAITSLSANKKQTELNDGEHEPHEANMRNLAKQTKNKSKRKKPDQPSSIDTSSNLMNVEKGYESERTSLVSHQLQSDVHEAELVKVTGVESLQPLVSTPEVNGEITAIKPKKRAQRKHSDSENNSSILHMKQQSEAKTPKTVVEQADDVTPIHIVNDADHQEKVSLLEKCHDGSTEVRKPDSQLPSNLKADKLDLLSSVDTSCNGQNLNKVSERNDQAGIELQNNVRELELSGQISQHEEHLHILSVEVIKPKEVSSSLAETRIPEKPRASKQKVKNKDLPTSAVAESKGKNLTVSTSLKKVTATQVPVSDAVNTQVGALGQNNSIRKSGVSCPNLDDGSKSSGTSSLISGKSAKTIHMGKNLEVQKRKNQVAAFKTPSNKKNQEIAFKTPLNKNVGLPMSSVPQKKHLPATSGGLFGGLYSDSSDGEVERNGSSCSTRTPDDLSSSDYSSDYSEGESKGDVVTSQHKSNGSQSAREKTNLNLSALKDLDIKSILRSSKRFKNAKLAALQSQLEDGESEPPEFVPDSLADS